MFLALAFWLLARNEAEKPEMAWLGLPLTLANPLVFVALWGMAFPGLEATRPKDYARAVEVVLEKQFVDGVIPAPAFAGVFGAQEEYGKLLELLTL